MTRISLAALLLSVCAGCSDAFRFGDNPFSNPFVARGDTSSTGSVRSAPRQTAYHPPAASSSRIVASPLPAPSTSAIQQLQTRPARAVASTAARPAVLSAPATTGSIKRVGTVAKDMPGWSTKGGTPVTLSRGETVETVANRYGVPAPVLLHVNGLPNSGAAAPGQTLIIPTYSAQRTSIAPTGQGLRPASLAALIDANPFVRAGEPLHLAFAGEAEDGPRLPVDAGDVLAYSEQDTAAQAATRKVRSVSSIAAPISIRPPAAVAPVAATAIVKTPTVKAAAKPAAKVKAASSGPIKAAKPKQVAAAPGHIVPAAPKAGTKSALPAKVASTRSTVKAEAASHTPAKIATTKPGATAHPGVKTIAKASVAKPATKALADKSAAGKPGNGKTATVKTVEAKPPSGRGAAPAAAPKALAKSDALPPDVSAYAADPAATGSLPPAALPQTENGLFRWPAKGRVISSFGSKDLNGTNNGINISMPEGTPVKAAEAGTVAYSGDDIKKYGKLVLIKHDNGYVSAYAHNGELDVRKGEVVKRGQVIAKSGSTGDVTSPQLHFQLRKGEQPVDPMKLLDTN